MAVTVQFLFVGRGAMRGLLFMYTCVCLCMSPGNVGSFGVGVPGSCKLPDIGARNSGPLQ